ncbi:hypothetical protein FBU59_005096 [Linderina macrospora]|uniref:Uncharacterized protein n=1 Tax=Linderina macrospora TaxID=4868 RepID=A0ACC1J3V3_9FUNG|nr:hypothetical protein FBU59_005096 [Linderina macrospora]
MSKLAKDILLKNGAPPTVQWSQKPKTLPELLNVQRLKAYKFKAQPEHWFQKGFEGCYYEIHKVKFKEYKGEPTHGKAWGIQFWNGQQMQNQPVEIKGGLKFSWRQYESPKEHGIVYSRDLTQTVERRRTNMLRQHGKASE